MATRGSSFSVESALSYGWNATKNNLGFFILLFLVVWVIELILYFLRGELGRNAPFVGFLFGLIVFLVGLFIQMNLIGIALRVYDNHQPRLEELFTVPPHWISFLIAGIIYGLAVGIGLLLFIIPGLYIAVRWLFYGYAVVDRNAEATQALGISWELTKRHILELFLLLVVLFFLNVIGAILLGVGLLITVPISLMATTYAYRMLQAPVAGGV